MSVEKEFVSQLISFLFLYANKPFGGADIQAGPPPSNIALVKYWGKYGVQLPQNPSLSFTLSKCVTTTHLSFHPKDNKNDFSFSFRFEGKEEPSFHPKIDAFFSRIVAYCPYLLTHHLDTYFINSFPHSGIASSASSMSALALAIVSIEKQAGKIENTSTLNKKASFLARLGSGSAARSIQGPMMSWGKTDAIEGSSNAFGTIIQHDIHPVFTSYQDTILIIDKGQKKVSSTLGHQLMESHYANTRFKQAHQHIEQLMAILAEGNLDDFMTLVELEALTLHALMMASNPYFVLMQPNTLSVLNKVWDFRESTKLPFMFYIRCRRKCSFTLS